MLTVVFILQNQTCLKSASCQLKLDLAEHHSPTGIMIPNWAAVLASPMVVVPAMQTDSRVWSFVSVSVANIATKVTVLAHEECRL